MVLRERVEEDVQQLWRVTGLGHDGRERRVCRERREGVEGRRGGGVDDTG